MRPAISLLTPEFDAWLGRIELAHGSGESPLKLMIDGDILGVTPLKIEVKPKAFTLLTPGSPPPS